jgi:hypothetical protein
VDQLGVGGQDGRRRLQLRPVGDPQEGVGGLGRLLFGLIADIRGLKELDVYRQAIWRSF